MNLLLRGLVTLLVVCTVVTAGVAPAAADSHGGGRFGNCNIDAEANVAGCELHEENIYSLRNGFTADNAKFWVKIDNIEVAGDDKIPYVMWLYTHGYATDEDTTDDVGHWDVNTSEAVLNDLEQYSTATLTVDVAAHGEITVETTEETVQFNDEPDPGERPASELMSGEVTVQATDIRVTDRAVYAQFDMAEILNKGMSLNGEFVSWSGRAPVIGDEVGSSSDIQFVFHDSPAETTTPTPTDDTTADTSWIDQLLGGAVDTVDGLLSGDSLANSIVKAIFSPFQTLANAILDVLTHVITSYPQVHPNPDVQEVHRLTFTVAALLAGVVFMAAGLLYMVGPVLGVSYQQVHLIIPRLVLALAFGAVSPILLQYAVDFADALTLAFKPAKPDLWSMFRLSIGLVIVWVFTGLELLLLAIIFVIRDVYILFAAAIAPLIALMWAVPYAKRFADSLIGAFWAALLIGPLTMLLLRFIIALLETPGTTPRWIYAIGGLAMMLVLPLMVFWTSQLMVGGASTFAFKRADPRRLRRRYERMRYQQEKQAEYDAQSRRPSEATTHGSGIRSDNSDTGLIDRSRQSGYPDWWYPGEDFYEKGGDES